MISLLNSGLILCSLCYVCFCFQFKWHRYRIETYQNVRRIDDDVNNGNKDNNENNAIISKGFGNVVYNNTANYDEKGKRSLQKKKYQELKKMAKSKSSVQKLVSGNNNAPDKGSSNARTKFW